MSTLGTALITARTYLNDDMGTVWTDMALIPKAQEAHRELQIKLWNSGSPAVREQSPPILVPAGSTDLGANQPIDMLQPFKLQEFGVTQAFSDAIDMTEKLFIPNVVLVDKLIYWVWREEKISFVGSTQNRNVIVYYRKSVPIPVNAGSEIGILFGEIYIGARTAAMAHGSVGNKEAMTLLSAECEKNFNMVVLAQRGSQTPPLRQ